MAYALVGTIGVASQGAASAAVTPAWGTSENRTAGNLLVCFVSVTGTATLTSTPSGWSVVSNQPGTSCSAAIYYKIAAGADAAPTITGVTSGLIAAQLAEFSGNATSPLDKGAGAAGTSSPLTVTLPSADTASGELLLISTGDFRSVARTPNDTLTSNHGTITQAGNNNAVSSVNHYSFGYCLATTSNAGATTGVMTPSVTTSITGMGAVVATFKFFTQALTQTASDNLWTSNPDDLLAENGTDFLISESSDTFVTESTTTQAEVVTAAKGVTRTATDNPTTATSNADATRTPRSITGTATDNPTTSTSNASAIRTPLSPSRTATDAVATSEAATGIRTLQTPSRTATDAVSTSESADAVRVAGGTSVSRTATDAPTTSESATAIRTPLAVTRTATDAVTTAEAVARIGSFIRIAGDTITTAESVTATKFAFIVRSTADAPTTSDAATRIGSFHPATTDALTTAEAIAKSATHTRTTTDAPTTAEAVTGSKFGVKTGTATDALTTADSAGRTGTFIRTDTDALSTAESATGSRSGLSISRTASEALATSEVVARIGSFHKAATDNPTTAELVIGTKFAFLARTASESLTAASEGYGGFPTTGLVSYWKLEEASGTRLDSFGTNHLSMNGTDPGVTPGKVGNAAWFRKFLNNNYLSCASNSSLQMSGNTDFTIAGWFGLSSNTDSSLVTKDSNAANSRDYTLDYNTTSGSWRFYIKGGANYIASVGNAGGIHFLVAWYDSSNGQLHLRVDDTTQNDSTTGATGTDVSSAEFRIGARQYSGFEDYTDGLADEVGVWKRVLTPAERTYLYNGGAGTTLTFGGATAVIKPAIVRTATDALTTSESPNAVRTGATAWIRTATDALSVTEAIPGLANNDPVVVWKDNSGRGLDSPSAAGYPIFQTNLTTNNKPAVYFSGVGEYILAPNAAISGLSSAVTVFLVQKNAALGGSAFTNSGGGAGSNRINCHCPYVDGNVYWDFGNIAAGGRVSGVGGDVTSNFVIWTFVAGGGTTAIYKNGTLLATVASSSTFAPTTETLGVGGGLYNENAWIAAFGLYNNFISGTDRANLEKFLGNAYGVTVAGGSAVDPTTITGLQYYLKSESLAGSPGAVAVVKPAIVRTATDALTISEAAVRTLVTSRAATDAPTISESAIRAEGEPRTATDHPATSEVATAVRGAVGITRTATDALTTSEAAARILSQHVTATDAPVTAEAITKSATHPRTATDAVATAETVTATRGAQSLTRTTSEALTTAESATGIRSAVSITRTATDALTTAESITKTATYSRTATDAPVTAEVASKAAAHPRTTADALTTAEVASKTSVQSRTTTDAPVIAETATAIRTGAGILARATVEAPTIIEAATWKLTALRAASDAPHTAELATGVRLGLSITRTATDAIATAETSTGARTPRSQGRTAADALQTSESASASKFGVVIRNATDTLTANLVANRVLVAGRTTGETLLVAESAGRIYVGKRVATDMLTVAENAFAGGTGFIFIAGSVAGSTPYVTVTGSAIKISVTNSALAGNVAGSNVNIVKTGSQLAVVKTT